MRLVGERHGKGDLVELVTWLLLRAEPRPTCGIAEGIHAKDALCTFAEAHDGPCSFEANNDYHGVLRRVQGYVDRYRSGEMSDPTVIEHVSNLLTQAQREWGPVLRPTPALPKEGT